MELHSLANCGSPQPFRDFIMEISYQSHDSVLSSVQDVEFSSVPLPQAISPSMRTVVGVIGELAHSSVPVLLVGEDGTGKHNIARTIHLNSGGGNENFQVKNCRELAASGLASEQLPAKASFYFSEICDLNLECQKKLLELLSGPGTNGNARHEIRVICGSSRDLEHEVRSGAFREDLYYRLSGVCLRIPPLRQRKEDILPLMTF